MTICESLVDQIALLPGLTKETVLQSVSERRFDHISAIYDLLFDAKEEEARNQGQLSPSTAGLPQPLPIFQFPVQRKASITTGVVERPEAPPEIQLLLNDSQIYEKVSDDQIIMAKEGNIFLYLTNGALQYLHFQLH